MAILLVPFAMWVQIVLRIWNSFDHRRRNRLAPRWQNPIAGDIGWLYNLSSVRMPTEFCDSIFDLSMPTYDYQCQTCGHAFEAKQSMKDPHLTECPQPGCAGPVRRKIGLGSGFIFKGSGFYITDYRSDAYKAAAKQDSSSGGAGTASASSGGSGGSSSSTT